MGTTCNLQWREDGGTERLWVVDPGHPIADGLDESIELPETEMYGEPFDVPEPDRLVFTSWFEGGEVFRSGCCYQRGNGRIFYFRPGHETFPIYENDEIRRVLRNAVEWATPTEGARGRSANGSSPGTPISPAHPLRRVSTSSTITSSSTPVAASSRSLTRSAKSSGSLAGRPFDQDGHDRPVVRVDVDEFVLDVLFAKLELREGGVVAHSREFGLDVVFDRGGLVGAVGDAAEDEREDGDGDHQHGDSRANAAVDAVDVRAAVWRYPEIHSRINAVRLIESMLTRTSVPAVTIIVGVPKRCRGQPSRPAERARPRSQRRRGRSQRSERGSRRRRSLIRGREIPRGDPA